MTGFGTAVTSIAVAANNKLCVYGTADSTLGQFSYDNKSAYLEKL